MGFLVLLCRCILPEILRPEPPLFSLILLSVSQNRQLNANGQKKAFSHSLVFTRDTRNRDREKRPVQTHLCNILTIGAIDRTLCQPQVKLNQYFFFKNSTTVKHNQMSKRNQKYHLSSLANKTKSSREKNYTCHTNLQSPNF